MQKKFTSNYSPERSLNASSSLKDFSMGVEFPGVAANSNDYYHNSDRNANNLDLDNNIKLNR